MASAIRLLEPTPASVRALSKGIDGVFICPQN